MPTLAPDDWQEPIDWLDVIAHALPVAVFLLVVLVYVLETKF